jgi:uncharacterized membrane protein SpoIIM required for sporulation
MKQDNFSSKYGPAWARMEAYLQKKPQPDPKGEFPRLYRQVCQHLALARRRAYSMHLLERLNALVLQGHQRLYSSDISRKSWLTHFFLEQFPTEVRREWRLVMVSMLLFFGPLAVMLAGSQWEPEIVYRVLEPETLRGMEAMYEPSEGRIGRERDSESDLLMFAYYIYNNTGIGFRTFASGLLFGLGTVFTLLYNGLVIGSIAGHLTSAGYGENFWSFVSGHSALELTAIVLSGAAGLRLGLALLSPGRYSRLHATRIAAKQSVRIVAGAATFFVLAAFVEAFWSSMSWLPVWLKYIVGLTMWPIVLGYLLLAGSRRAA